LEFESMDKSFNKKSPEALVDEHNKELAQFVNNILKEMVCYSSMAAYISSAIPI
jgi:hypothetical protein